MIISGRSQGLSVFFKKFFEIHKREKPIYEREKTRKREIMKSKLKNRGKGVDKAKEL